MRLDLLADLGISSRLEKCPITAGSTPCLKPSVILNLWSNSYSLPRSIPRGLILS